jgi:hypothetical protein
MEVFDEQRTRRKERRAGTEWESRKAGEVLACVQHQAVVHVCPRVSDLRAPLEHDVLDAAAEELARDGEARRTGAYDDDSEGGHGAKV